MVAVCCWLGMGFWVHGLEIHLAVIVVALVVVDTLTTVVATVVVDVEIETWKQAIVAEPAWIGLAKRTLYHMLLIVS